MTDPLEIYILLSTNFKSLMILNIKTFRYNRFEND